jgi:hypothetical protein
MPAVTAPVTMSEGMLSRWILIVFSSSYLFSFLQKYEKNATMTQNKKIIRNFDCV